MADRAEADRHRRADRRAMHVVDRAVGFRQRARDVGLFDRPVEIVDSQVEVGDGERAELMRFSVKAKPTVAK